MAGIKPGLAALVAGKVAPKIVAATEHRVERWMDEKGRRLTARLANWLGLDSALVHLCAAVEAAKKRR